MKIKKYRLTDVLWWNRKDEVMKEIASIMDIESADTNTAGWFPHRNLAAKNLLDNMSSSEINKLRVEAAGMSQKGFPEELQRK
jgi:hypothetical protein